MRKPIEQSYELEMRKPIEQGYELEMRKELDQSSNMGRAGQVEMGKIYVGKPCEGLIPTREGISYAQQRHVFPLLSCA